MSSIHDGKTRMGRKARILLIFLIVTCASAISAAFHNCYVIDAYHPELPANVYPSINFMRINPGIYYDAGASTSIDLSQICENETKMMSFSILEIFDPDEEPVMYGKYSINYEGPQPGVTPSYMEFELHRSTIEDEKTGQWVESSTLWEASFNMSINDDFSPAGTYEVLAAVSDRQWTTATTSGVFDVPEDTQAVFVKWVIVTTGTLRTSDDPACQ